MVANRDRAQLILIGGIVIALLVLGIALVVNSVLFIENADVSESSVSLSESAKLDAQVTRATRSVALRVNHRTRNHSASNLGNYTSDNLTGLGSLLTETYIESQSTAVRIEYNHSSSQIGSRIVQAQDGNLTKPGPSGSGNWVVTNAGHGDKLGWFVLNIDGSLGSTGIDDSMNITVKNSSGRTIEYEINQTNGSNYNVTSEPSWSTPATKNEPCKTQNSRLFLNFKRGKSVTDASCTFNGTSEMRNVTYIQFKRGDNVEGKFAVVKNDPTPGLGYMEACNSTPTVPTDEACFAPVVWRANVTIDTTGAAQRYTKEKNITIYREGA